MTAQKLLVVIGATGSQGGSVIKSILADESFRATWKIRAITRNPSSEKAKALVAQGVECVAADLDSKATLTKAFTGAEAVFAVTNYWEKADLEYEIKQGKNVADAAKEQGVKHLVWSSLLDVNKLSGGKYADVYHFDSKARVEEYIKQIGQPATFFLAGFYMSNLPLMLRKGEDGIWVLGWPVPDDTPFPLLDAEEDTGKFVKAIIMNPDRTLEKRIYGATAYTTPRQMLDAISRVKPSVRQRLQYRQLPGHVFQSIFEKMGMQPYMALELLQTYEFIPEFGYFGKESLDDTLDILTEEPTTFEQFIANSPVWKDMD